MFARYALTRTSPNLMSLHRFNVHGCYLQHILKYQEHASARMLEVYRSRARIAREGGTQVDSFKVEDGVRRSVLLRRQQAAEFAPLRR